MVVVSVRAMIIDCDTCTVRGAACADCVVTFLTIPVRAAEPARAHRPTGPVHPGPRLPGLRARGPARTADPAGPPDTGGTVVLPDAGEEARLLETVGPGRPLSAGGTAAPVTAPDLPADVDVVTTEDVARPLGGPVTAAPVGTTVDLDAAEQRAIGVLAASGLVPPLRLVRAV